MATSLALRSPCASRCLVSRSLLKDVGDALPYRYGDGLGVARSVVASIVVTCKPLPHSDGKPKRLTRRMTMKRTATALVMAVVVLLGSSRWLTGGQQSAGQPQRQGQPPAGGPGQGNFSSVTKEQYEQWMKQYSNSGRWGKDDEK